MDRLAQKRSSRHARSIKIKRDRVISLYVKTKHPEVYQDAERIYQMLDKRYPKKRDLTKTSEFLSLTTTYSTFTDLYRDTYKKRKADQKEKTIPGTQEMRLEISLMNIPPRQKDDEQQLCLTQDTYSALLDELRKDPELQKTFESIMDDTSPPQFDVDENIQLLGSSQPDQTGAESPSLSQQLDDLMGEIDDILPDLQEQSPLENYLQQLRQ